MDKPIGPEIICPNEDFLRKNGGCGVYKIMVDEKYFYVGSSCHLEARIKNWIKRLSYPSHPNNTYKIRALKRPIKIEVYILEYCDRADLLSREDFYIKQYYDDSFCLNFYCSAIAQKGNKYPKWILDQIAAKRRPPLEFKLRPLHISKTESEWVTILEKIKSLGKKDLSVFIRSEVRKLCSNYNYPNPSVPKNSEEKIVKRPYIPEESFNKLSEISLHLKIPVSAVVNRLIITPLLQP